MTFFLILVIWITKGGVVGAGPFYISILATTVVLIHKSQRLPVLVGLLLLELALVYYEYVLKGGISREISITYPLDLLLLSFILVFVLLTFKTNFEKERTTTLKYTKSLQHLHRLNLSKGNLDSLMLDYLSSGCELFGIDNGFVAKLEGQNFVATAVHGAQLEAELGWKMPLNSIYALNDLRSGKTTSFNKQIWDDPVMVFNLELRAYIAVPILINNRISGFVCFFSTQPRKDDFEGFEYELVELMSQNLSQLMKIKAEEVHNRRINDALLQSELRFRSIFEKSPVGIALTALDGDFLLANPAISQMLGYTEYELLQMNVRDIITDSSGSRARWELLKEGRIETYTVEHEATHKEGQLIKIAVATSLVKSNNIEVPLVLGIVEDITKLKEREAQIAELNEQLEHQIEKMQSAYKELESFSYSVSHDLRAPLRAINSFSTIMMEEYANKLDQEGNRLLKIISRNGERMGQLIDDLLEFSRLSRLDRVFSEFSLKPLIIEVINETKYTFPHKEFEFVVGELPTVNGDRAMLRQLIRNLISNAMKFSSINEHPVVEIFQVNENKKYHQIAVKDNGVGFDMKYYDKLFGVFQRLHADNEFEGTGVGLAIVQRIVQRHEGKIWAESEVGKGAVFYFTLPR